MQNDDYVKPLNSGVKALLRREHFLVLWYQLVFIAMSMLIVYLLEGYGSEMFAYTFYFNLFYIKVGAISNYISYLVLLKIFSNSKKSLFILHFFSCLLIMNFLSFNTNNTSISFTFLKQLFTEKDERFWMALAIQIVMFCSYTIAVIITRKRIKNVGSNIIS